MVIPRVQEFLASLKDTEVQLEVLRYSGIHVALNEIAAVGSRWPSSLVLVAEEILRKWQDQLGPLSEIRADLWGPGGRLEGIPKHICWGLDSGIKHPDEPTTQAVKKLKIDVPNWLVAGAKGHKYPLHFGHNGFRVGRYVCLKPWSKMKMITCSSSWWINLPSAYRDGIIHCSIKGITADDLGAYAIVMTDNQAIDDTEGSTTYVASSTDNGRFKLTKNMTDHNLVRVLRTFRLNSKLAPEGGVRYDGLLVHC